MSNSKKSVKEKIAVLMVIYPVGIFLVFLLCVFRILRWIKISRWERFPTYERNPNLYKNGLILISNHPSVLGCMLEVFLPVLFFRDYLKHPFRLRPFSVPDKRNFSDRWYWNWIKPVAVPIDRMGGIQKKARALLRLIKILKSGGINVIFAEGGRTFTGDEFQYSAKGKRIRTLQDGVALLIQKTGAVVLPVWVEDRIKTSPDNPNPKKLYHRLPEFWKGVIVKIGNPIRFEDNLGRDEIIQTLTTALLNLADEPC